MQENPKDPKIQKPNKKKEKVDEIVKKTEGAVNDGGSSIHGK